ncbi:MAG: pyrimidine dimer DNA glycosylase/endonuclease V [Candidatus Thermoplasmatota archaeon]|nr:pyrimidine dimer DNA glycosylase/endonuclease V [Candidatus Thermoplasmatota archaeon]
MRLWSIHPKYLDQKGLVALWREGLLAKAVLEGKTQGYRNHPQLIRFRNMEKPTLAINAYLFVVLEEAKTRGYCFDALKLGSAGMKKILVTNGQLEYEFNHLLSKLKDRDLERYQELKKMEDIQTHPLFTAVEGKVEEWEKVAQPL